MSGVYPIREIEGYDVWEAVKGGCDVGGLPDSNGVLCRDIVFIIDGDYNLYDLLKYLEGSGYRYVGDKGTFMSYEKVMGTVDIDGIRYGVKKEVDIDKKTLYIIIVARLVTL